MDHQMAPRFTTINKRIQAACLPLRQPCLPMSFQRSLNMRLGLFRFLELPLEIRMMIYELLFDLSSIDDYLERYVNLFEVGDGRLKQAPFNRLVCPSILLVNREIFLESKHFLYAKPLVITHSLVRAKLTDIVSEDLLRNLTHIHLSDLGHTIIDNGRSQSNTNNAYFHGLSHLYEQLAAVLRKGHKLKEFTVSVKDEGLGWHLRNCLEVERVCGVNSFVAHFKRVLSQVHGVGKVVIEGAFPEGYREELEAIMESRPYRLLELPRSVRNKIYGFAANMNDGPRLYSRFVRAKNAGLSPKYPRMITPTILLLNHEIHDEARHIIFAQPLRIETQGLVTDMQRVPDIFRFISRKTFSQTVHLRLVISHWTWATSISDLVRVLQTHHNLKTLHLHLQYHPDNWLSQELHEGLSSLTRLRELDEATIMAPLIDQTYVRGLERNMVENLADEPAWPLYVMGPVSGWQRLDVPPERQHCVAAEYPVENKTDHHFSLQVDVS